MTARLAVLRRAARVTVAACTGFYTCRYLLGDLTTATYAIFGTIALGALSQVSGRPSERARTYLGALGAGALLICLGTVLAVSTWAAVAGMLLVGFAVAYAGIGGPRLAEVANGLQLFYVLPCFPPYDLGSLPHRLEGLAIGVALLAAADLTLWPSPGPPRFRDRVADAAGQVARYAAALRLALAPAAAPGALADPDLLALRDAAAAAAATLRLGELPMAERPTGPGRRDRGLIYVAAAVRNVSTRLGALTDLLGKQQVTSPSPATAVMIGTVAETLEAVRLALLGEGPVPCTGAIDDAVAEYVRQRAARLAHAGASPPPALRSGVTTLAIAEAARTATLASGGLRPRARRGAHAEPPPPDRLPPALWFLRASTPRLWWQRLNVHLTPRSVYLQNAVRLALGLAVARAVAGVFDLSHGFWVLLATLSLMRTSLIAIRSTLVPAFAGTVAGAAVAAGIVTAVGPHTAVYTWSLPVVMLAALAVGPLLGTAATQGAFTVLVAILFAQLAPSTYELAAVRLIDVLIGGLVGAVIGAAVWPRGAGSTLRRTAAAGLRAGASQVVATTRALTGGGVGDDPSTGEARMARMATLFDHAYAQYRTEPTRDRGGADWLTVLAVLHRMDSYGRALRVRHPAPGPLPWPDLSEQLCTEAIEVSLAYRTLADEIEHGDPPEVLSWPEQHSRLAQSRPAAGFSADPEAALRVFDTWGWLHDLVDDVARIEHALDPSGGSRSSPVSGETVQPLPQ